MKRKNRLIRLWALVLVVSVIVCGCASDMMDEVQVTTGTTPGDESETEALLAEKDQIIARQQEQIHNIQERVDRLEAEAVPRSAVTFQRDLANEAMERYPSLQVLKDWRLQERCTKVIISGHDYEDKPMEAVIEDKSLIAAMPFPYLYGTYEGSAYGADHHIRPHLNNIYHYEIHYDGGVLRFDVLGWGIVQFEGIDELFLVDPYIPMPALAFLEESRWEETVWTRMYDSGLIQYSDSNYNFYMFDQMRVGSIARAFYHMDKRMVKNPKEPLSPDFTFTFHHYGMRIRLACYEKYVQLQDDNQEIWYEAEPIDIDLLSSTIHAG